MDNYGENQWRESEAEIDLRQLLAELLKSVKPILLCAVICGLLLAGVQFAGGLLSEYRAKNAGSQAEPTTYERQLEAYNLQLASYKNQLETTREALREAEAYRKSSMLLNMDPQNFYQKDAIWYVDTHYQISPSLSVQNTDPIGSIMSAYATLLSSEDFYTYVQGRLSDSVDCTNLKELIFIGTDAETAFIRVTTLGTTERMADETLSAIAQYLESHRPQIKDAVSGFDISLVEEWAYSSAGLDSAADAENGGYMSYIISKQDAANDALNSLQATAAALQQSILDLKVPEDPDKGSPLKSGVIGIVLGAVLAGIFVAIRFVSKDAALSEDEIGRRYGVPVLSSVRRFTGKSRWQRMLSRLSGDAKRVPTVEEATGLAQANIASILEADGQKGAKVLLVGKDTGALSEIERLAAGKQESVIAAGGDIMTDKGAVETLREYENVVLVERKEKTSYREIGRELEKLALLNKKVVGLIAL